MASGLPNHFPVPVNHSGSVQFLTSLPRWGGGNASTFDLDKQYFLPTALSAFIPVIAGVLVTLVLIFALLLRMGRARQKVDATLLLVATNPRDYIWHIPISVVLFFAVISFIAQGCIGAWNMLRSLRDALDVIKALFSTVQSTAFEIVDLVILFVQKLKVLDATQIDVTKLLPSASNEMDKAQLAAAFEEIKSYVLSQIPDVTPLKGGLEEVKKTLELLLGQIVTIMELVLRYGVYIYSGLLALLSLPILGPLALFGEDAMFLKGVRRLWRCTILIVCLFMSVATAWILLGVASAVGLVVSDSCVVLADYRRHILGVRGDVSSGVPRLERNVIIESGLTCMKEQEAEKVKGGLDAVLAPLNEPVVAQTVTMVLKVSADAFVERARRSARTLGDFIDCKTLVDFTGSLEYIVCGAGGHSTSRSIADMWSAFLGLSVTLSIMFLLASFGMRVTWGLYVWPMALEEKNDDDDVGSDRDVEQQQQDEMSVEAIMPSGGLV